MDILNAIFTFGPIAIAAYAWGIKPYLKRRGHSFQASIAAPETIAEATEEKPLAMRSWLDYVNAQADTVPHVAVIGPTGSGKTTLTLAILHDRAGQIVILSGKEGDYWGGLLAIGIDDDLSYRTANRTVSALLDEVKRRNLAAKQQRLTADWLTIVIDDFSTLVKECEQAADLVKLVARIGRSLRIRLVMLSDSALVKAIGLDGEGETRSNFAFIRLKRGHTATLDIDDRAVPIETSLAPQLARKPIAASRSWSIPRDPNDELADLIGLSAGDRDFDASNAADRQTDEQTDGRRDALVKELARAGVKRDDIRAAVKAAGWSIDNNRISELSKELHQ